MIALIQLPSIASNIPITHLIFIINKKNEISSAYTMYNYSKYKVYIYVCMYIKTKRNMKLCHIQEFLNKTIHKSMKKRFIETV